MWSCASRATRPQTRVSSTPAGRLLTTQPAISKQLQALEYALGFDIFVRKGRLLTGITSAGQRVLAHAPAVVRQARNINDISAEFRHAGRGSLSIGTTHTQARYPLPPVIRRFRADYPEVEFHLNQGTAEPIAAMSRLDRINFAIAAGSYELFHDHVLGSSGSMSVSDAFSREGLHASIALTTRDAEVIKTYLRPGLGVGIVAGVAVDFVTDADLVAIDASHLFPAHVAWVGFTRGTLLRGYMYEFLQLLAPHLTRTLVDRAASCGTQEEVAALVAHVELPVR